MRLFKPVTDHTDTFRELVDLWAEAGYCEIVPTESKYVWLDGVGEILLYDWDRYDHLPQQWRIGLFGNPAPIHPRSHSWTYFPRRPRLLEQQIATGVASYHERPITSIFLGRVENPVQGQNRISAGVDWENYIELFSCPVVIGEAKPQYRFSQSEYLAKVSQAKFGLSLPGYGPKCNRDIELFGLGTVPLMTPGIDTENYFEPLVENVHFLRVNSASEIPEVISRCTPEMWSFLSANGRAWYERNCSRSGSWNLAMRILRAAGAWEPRVYA